MATFTRQPFADLGAPRLYALSSSKNRQNARAPTYASPIKPTAAPSTGKRQRDAEPDIFEDDDAENVDPGAFSSPPKKSRTASDVFTKPSRSVNDVFTKPSRSAADAFTKPARYSLTTTPAKSMTASPASSLSSVRKTVSSPNTARSTPISCSRGSPKNKRVHAISKRRASSSTVRRVDPPSFSLSSPALPFSIDAALSGTLQNYTPKPAVKATPVPMPAPMPAPAPPSIATLDESMPNSWFFEIFEDTPEQEASNLMEHSASVLDISSEDDAETKLKNDELERGKENVPPSDFTLTQSSSTQPIDTLHDTTTPLQEPVKRQRMRTLAQDAMDEDRRPLGDLCPSAFYGAGLDANSYVTVDTGIEKPSSLSREVDINAPTPQKKSAARRRIVDLAAEAAPREKQRSEVKTSPVDDAAEAHVEAESEPETRTENDAETSHTPSRTSPPLRTQAQAEPTLALSEGL